MSGISVLFIFILSAYMMYFFYKLIDSRLVNEIGKNVVFFKGGCGYIVIGDIELFFYVF